MFSPNSFPWYLSLFGMAAWIITYFIDGHPTLLPWSSVLPDWLAGSLPNREAELAAIVTCVGNGMVLWKTQQPTLHRDRGASPDG
jgi:hypothetical protein